MARKGHDGQHRLQLVKNVSMLAPEEAFVEGETGQMQMFKLEPTLAECPPLSAKLSALQNENNELNEKNGRLKNTVVSLTEKIKDHVVAEKAPDVVISHSQDLDKGDVAWVHGALPAEPYYPHSTGQLAELVQMTASRLGRLFSVAGIKGNRLYHYQMAIGKKSCSQKYRATALQALYEAAIAGNVPEITEDEVARLKGWLQIVKAFK